MLQPEGFEEKGNDNLVCTLKRSIYGLKQASRQLKRTRYMDFLWQKVIIAYILKMFVNHTSPNKVFNIIQVILYFLLTNEYEAHYFFCRPAGL
jgi:hypothetical protein